MEKSQAMLFLAVLCLTIGTGIGELPKPSYARTMLKVSRSLPGETEELKVRTSEGSLATLIVKRRDKSVLEDSQTNRSSIDQDRTDIERRKDQDTSDDMTISESKKKEDVRKLEDAQIQHLKAQLSDSEVRTSPEKSANRSEDVSTGADPSNEKIIGERVIDYGRWIPLGEDGRALKTDEPTTEEYQSWKPLQTDLKTTTEERTNYARFSGPNYPGLVLLRNFQDRTQRNLELTDRSDEANLRYAFPPHQTSRPTRTNLGANLSKNRDAKNVPPEVIVRSEINVKSSPKRSPMSLDRDGTPVIHGKRVPDEPIDKIQTWRNARVINNKLIHDGSRAGEEVATNFYPGENAPERQRFERFFKNVNRRYGRNFDEDGRNVFFEWDPKNYKNEALKAEVYEARNENYRSTMHKRMLHPEGIASYPNSQLYTPESQKIAPVALKPGARAPVLQYAHPELGVQPAKIVKNEKRRPDNFPENQHSFTEQRQKKKYVLNDKNIIDTYTTKNYYPNQHFYGVRRPNDTPFWVKISENLKNQFSTGVERVSQFTRPVIDPLVEATHKISQNLGLSKGKERQGEAQDKIGTVASGTSMLIPALGLMASGAALGIGAVAVGRYLDVDVLKRSNENDVELEHKRALGSADFIREMESSSERDKFTNGQEVYLLDLPVRGSTEGRRSLEDAGDVMVVLEEEKSAEKNEDMSASTEDRDRVERGDRRRRSLDDLDVFNADGNLRSLIRSKRFQRKGADSISEIVEIDLPSREGNIEVTEFLIPRKESKPSENAKDDAILVINDGSVSSTLQGKDFAEVTDQDAVGNVVKLVEEIAQDSNEVASSNSVSDGSSRRRRSLESDQELDDALQNLENAEVAEVAHIDADWTNTPCAKRIFCEQMIQRLPDAAIFMEKKMAGLLSLIQPGAAVQVSGHFQEVMDAVRRHDCSRFTCPQTRPGNVFL